jgi:CubicO group peptidase (beta-lactamase class C family)
VTRALVLACAMLASWAAQALPDDVAVKALLEERIAQKRGVGFAAVLVDAAGTRIVTAGVMRAGGPPIAADTEFEIGSVTKTFTSLLLADMVVRKEAALDDPVTKFLPEAKGLAGATLGELATHTSGLPRLPKNMTARDPTDPYADYDAAKLLAFLSGSPLQRGPGSEYEYSNLGAGVLGYALTWRSGGYEKVLRERVLAPLAMRDTAITLSPAQRERFAAGYDRLLQPASAWNLATLAGAGGLRSTPSDMAKYLKAAIDPSTSALAAAFALAETPAASGPAPTVRVALAWHVSAREGRTIVWHNGQTGGYAAMMAFNPATGEGAAVLSNASISVDDLALHMIDPSVPLSAPPKEHIAVKVDAAGLDRIAGRYELARDFVLTIRRDGDRAFAQATGQPEAEIFAEGDSEFFYKVVDAQLTFAREGGRVTGLVLHQGGRDIKARRIE